MQANKDKISSNASGFGFFGRKRLRFLLAGVGLAFLGLVATFMLVPLDTSATSHTSTVKVTLDNGIAIRIMDKELSKEITGVTMNVDNSPTGTFVKNSFYVQVATSNPTGYSLYMSSNYCLDPNIGAITTSADCNQFTNALVNPAAPSYTFPSISTDTTEEAFSTSANINRWGYTKSWSGGGDDKLYLAIPEHDGATLIRETASADTASNTLISIGLNAGMDNIPGYYQNTLVFTGVGNATPIDYSVIFDSNGSGVSNMPANLSKTVEAGVTSFTLPSNIPTKSGYTFGGWIDTNANYGNKGSIIDTYSPGDSITIHADPETLTGSVALKAKWNGTSWAAITTMQEMTTDICSAAPMEETKTLVDIRPVDSSGTTRSYTVAKLKDNHCWMTQNLRLVGDELIELSEKDSQVGSGGFILSASDNGAWCTDLNSECVDKSMTFDTNRSDYGAYYNWYAATAGSGKYSTTSGNAAQSICAKGWRLPTGGSSGEWQTLYGKYNSSALLRGSPVNLALSGLRLGSSASDQSSYGDYWASTTYNQNHAYGLLIYKTDGNPVNPAHYYTKYAGFTVRCLAQ